MSRYTEPPTQQLVPCQCGRPECKRMVLPKWNRKYHAECKKFMKKVNSRAYHQRINAKPENLRDVITEPAQNKKTGIAAAYERQAATKERLRAKYGVKLPEREGAIICR